MDKRGFKNIILLVIFLLYIVSYKLFIFHNFMKYSEIINASFFVVYFTFSAYLLGFRRDKASYASKSIMKVVLFYLVLTFVVMYALGGVSGFLKNAYSRDSLILFDNIFAPIITIILTELFRYVFIWANRDKKIYIFLATVLICLFDVVINIRALALNDTYLLFNQFATIIVPSIVKNIVMSYLCYHVGYKIPIVYRLVMDLYSFVIPVIPDIGDYLTSMILIALPTFIYVSSFSIIDERNKKVEFIFEKSSFNWTDIPVFCLLAVVAALVSGFFPHFMIGVGSNSMAPYIKKGDAIIIRKLDKNTDVEVGDVIAFKSDKKIVVHRVDDVSKSNGKTVYITKGDANNSVDINAVKKKQIKGIVKIRIPYIAIPTVWLSEYFHK